MSGHHPRIVVAPSDPREGRLLARTLKAGDYRVARAGEWHACERYLKGKTDLLLLDLSIKEAWRLLKGAKKKNGNGHGVPVLAYDHRRNPLREIKAFRLGADGYIGRPQLKEELLSSVGPLLRQRQIEEKWQGELTREKRRRETLGQELKRVQGFTEKIASNVPLSIIIVDSERRLTYVNRNFSRVSNRDERFLVGRHLDEIFPEDLYGPVELIEKVDLVLRGGHPTPRFAMRYRGDSYTYRVLPLTSRPSHLGKGEGSRQAMILIENISEIKSLGEMVKISEERYRTLFEHSPDGIVVTSSGGGRVLDSNRQAAGLLGIKRSLLQRRSFLGLFPKEARRVSRKILDGDQWNKGRCEIPDLVMKADQKFRTLAVSASRILHRGEDALLWHLRDITEKRFLEDQVRQSEKMSFLGQFTAGAAHEINNPLAIISSHAQYLASQVDERKPGRSELQEIRETLHLIDRESRFCGGIIKNLLAYTHTREAIKKPVDLEPVIQNCLGMVQHQLNLSKVEVEREADPDLPRVLGDENLLQQVLMNLIWNAQAAMAKGGTLRVRTMTQDGGGEIELAVADTGTGIPSENLDKIFTPFFTTKGVGKGTGLGLWVVRSIIDELKGTIEVKSKIGKGTEVRIRLPALAAATKEGGNPPNS